MQCADVTERLLGDELGSDPGLDLHVNACARCSHLARGLKRVERILASTLVVAPPLELQRQLAQLALNAARPQTQPWWARAFASLEQWNPVAVLQRPQMVAVQGLAAVMLALASWQIFGWLSMVQPVVGDVGYAMQLVAASPASVYLSGLQIDLPSLGLWTLIGIVGWLISEDSPIGRRLSTFTRLRLP